MLLYHFKQKFLLFQKDHKPHCRSFTVSERHGRRRRSALQPSNRRRSLPWLQGPSCWHRPSSHHRSFFFLFSLSSLFLLDWILSLGFEIFMNFIWFIIFFLLRNCAISCVGDAQFSDLRIVFWLIHLFYLFIFFFVFSADVEEFFQQCDPGEAFSLSRLKYSQDASFIPYFGFWCSLFTMLVINVQFVWNWQRKAEMLKEA